MQPHFELQFEGSWLLLEAVPWEGHSSLQGRVCVSVPRGASAGPSQPRHCWALIQHCCVDRQEGPGSLNLQEGAVASLWAEIHPPQRIRRWHYVTAKCLSSSAVSRHSRASTAQLCEGGGDAALTGCKTGSHQLFAQQQIPWNIFLLAMKISLLCHLLCPSSLSSSSLGLWQQCWVKGSVAGKGEPEHNPPPLLY